MHCEAKERCFVEDTLALERTAILTADYLEQLQDLHIILWFIVLPTATAAKSHVRVSNAALNNQNTPTCAPLRCHLEKVRGEKSDRKFTVLVGSRARCSCGVTLCLHHLFVMLKVCCMKTNHFFVSHVRCKISGSAIIYHIIAWAVREKIVRGLQHTKDREKRGAVWGRVYCCRSDSDEIDAKVHV